MIAVVGLTVLSRKFTEQELRHTLDLLNSIPRPLSPTLPPSPPASPAPPSQRRRITPETDHASTSSAQDSPAAPPRRPALTPAELARIVPVYKERAKLFKRSGDSRKRTELRSSRLGLMELTDSVLHFAYVFWAEDRQRSHRGSVYSFVEVNTWRTLEGLVSACKIGWSKDNDPAARGLYGMLILLEALVLNKMTFFHMSHIREATKGLIIQPPAQNPSPSNLNVNPNAGTTPNPNAAGTPNHPTPPSHVPSPAPTTSRSPVPPAQTAQQQQQPPSHRPLPEFYLPNILKHSGQYIQSQLAIANAHALLNASFMHAHFPRTHTICMNTTLGTLEEATGDAGFVRLSDDGMEVDVDACVRGEGLWAWPILSGAGMAHLVGFGRSLLWEYGLTRGGYRGAEGMNMDY
ncbi:hypothetical protein RhiJN_21951 [Ceratobasidium sp. AG-Ba]|nr:hypothetical protein RhiJN_21951 [Ceratobasidium sp. AG-Ba]